MQEVSRLTHHTGMGNVCVYTPCIRGDHMSEAGFRIRIDTQLRQEFVRACREQDLTASQVLRAFIREYVDRHAATQQHELFKQERAQ